MLSTLTSYQSQITRNFLEEEKQVEEKFLLVIQEIADECIDQLIRIGRLKKYLGFKKLFEVKLERSARSWGGCPNTIPKIAISTSYMVQVGNFWEYPHIAEDYSLGSFYSKENIDHVRCVVAHEVAHAAEIWNNKNDQFNSHGKAWQGLYRPLRIMFSLTGLPPPR